MEVPVRLIAERHVIEDLGWIPSPNDYWSGLPIAGWMSGAKLREEPLSLLGVSTSVSGSTDEVKFLGVSRFANRIVTALGTSPASGDPVDEAVSSD